MFVTDKRFRCVVDGLRKEIEFVSSRYWELRHRHDLLLTKLGLYEHEIKKHTVLRSKEGPERDD